MADLGLDVDALRRDRDRYQALLAHAEEQISAWNERADSVQQAIGGIDQLLALAGADGAVDGGPARGSLPGRAAGASWQADRQGGRAGGKKKPSPSKRPAPQATAPAGGSSPRAETDADSGVAPDAPKGTDAVRAILEEDLSRAFTLGELLAELEERRWLTPSRRPEELVRINLKRLAERGGAVRTEDGRWRAPGAAPEGSDASDAAPAPAEETPPPPAESGPPGGSQAPIVGSNVREW